MRKHVVLPALAAIAALVGFAAPAYAAESGDIAVTSVVVNGGRNVVVGITVAKTFTVSVTASDDSGIMGADFFLYGPGFGYLGPNQPVSCTATSATESTCKGTFTVDPRVDLYDNSQAGIWYVDVWVDAYDYDFYSGEKAASFKLQRYSKLTTNAWPEPVRKGSTVTVTGALTRANWETHAYSGYTSQPVRLEFRKLSGLYAGVKTVYTGSGGALKTGVTASVDGCWRWRFAGTSTTSPVTATGDCVDVR